MRAQGRVVERRGLVEGDHPRGVPRDRRESRRRPVEGASVAGRNDDAPGYAIRQNTIAFPPIVTVTVVAFWVWRDGFSRGNVLGRLLIRVVAFGTLAALRWYTSCWTIMRVTNRLR